MQENELPEVSYFGGPFQIRIGPVAAVGPSHPDSNVSLAVHCDDIGGLRACCCYKFHVRLDGRCSDLYLKFNFKTHLMKLLALSGET
eukprot:4083754-Amphidinium_carterae.1